jgi:hypothetical protein
MKTFRVIFMEFESLEVTYAPFSKVVMLVVCLFLPTNVLFGRCKRFGF